MIVVDTNIIAAYCGLNEHREKVRQIWIQDQEWHAPLLWISELRNMLALHQRRGLISTGAFTEVMLEARELVPLTRIHDVDDEQVLALAVQSGCTAYDCEFVAVAEILDVPLLTWDKQLLKQFPRRAVTPEEFLKS